MRRRARPRKIVSTTLRANRLSANHCSAARTNSFINSTCYLHRSFAQYHASGRLARVQGLLRHMPSVAEGQCDWSDGGHHLCMAPPHTAAIGGGVSRTVGSISFTVTCATKVTRHYGGRNWRVTSLALC